MSRLIRGEGRNGKEGVARRRRRQGSLEREREGVQIMKEEMIPTDRPIERVHAREHHTVR